VCCVILSRWAAKAARLPALLLSAIAASFETHELQVYFFSPDKREDGALKGEEQEEMEELTRGISCCSSSDGKIVFSIDFFETSHVHEPPTLAICTHINIFAHKTSPVQSEYAILFLIGDETILFEGGSFGSTWYKIFDLTLRSVRKCTS